MIRSVVAGSIALALAAPAAAVARVSFRIPAGSLADAAVAIGSQAGVTIGLIDPGLAAVRVRGFAGRASVAGALRILLGDGPAGFRQIDPATFQIVRRAPRRTAIAPAGAAPEAAAPAIVVTGSKRATRLADYPGSVAIVAVGGLRPGDLSLGSGALVAQLPLLAATNLGPGRDKLFIRGIADSSFSGPTQATVGQYLGEVRLNYNAPDPDLALYDIASVELLEGPQGTLYGAGSLGGIVRLVPQPPDLDRRSLGLIGGGAVTSRGGPGGDGAVIVNLPLAAGRAALRLVAYARRDDGYIDDPSRRIADVNRTSIRGGRATLRIQAAASWTIDLGGVVQNIDSRDGQYADRQFGPLARANPLAQPFDNDYALASLVVRHPAGSADLISATSLVMHHIDSEFDASSAFPGPTLYDAGERVAIIANETRLSHRAGSGLSWVIGSEALHGTDSITRTLGPPGRPQSLGGTRNTVGEVSLYGEATLTLARGWALTGGARAAYTRLTGKALDQPGGDSPARHRIVLLPSLGLLWRRSARLAFYARYQEGYRPGGLSVQGGTAERLDGDSLATSEIGLRLGGDGDRFELNVAGSFAHWENIQADLVDRVGLPYTANIGSGHVLGFELRSVWRPLPSLAIDAALFADQSRLSRPAPGYSGREDATLPNIPAVVGRLGASQAIRLFGRPLRLYSVVHYVGRSRLGIGPLFDLPQGNYVEASLGASRAIGRSILSLDLTNLFDSRRNSFALGDPFGAAQGRQTTPLRPRTLRIGGAVQF